MGTPMTYVFSQEQHQQLLPYIAALHAACILSDHMVGPFVPPLTNEKLLPWWRERIAEANQGTRVIVLLLPEMLPGQKPAGTDLRGLAMLKLAEDETATFRGNIDTVLVNKSYRRQGGAKALVTALEYEAAKRGRTLLIADAESDSAAELMFEKFGYVKSGTIPEYSRFPPNGSTGNSRFYKNLLAGTT